MSSASALKCPDPGIYYDVKAEDYFAWDAVSNSRLGLMSRSPMHYKHGFGESTPAMRLGSLVHSGVLEPLSIAKRYVFMPDYSNHPGNTTASGDRSFSSSTKFVKQMQEQFRTLNFDKEIIDEADYNTMIGMAFALEANNAARGLLRDLIAEVSIVWVDDKTGLTCKARVDGLKVDDGKLIDLKTTEDCSQFERAIGKYGYHRQMAFYTRGLAACGIDAEPWIVAVEKKAPFGCRTAPMDVASLAEGRKECDRLLGLVSECQESNKWPGYTNPDAWSCPDWCMSAENDAGELSSWFESALAAK